MAHNAQAVLQKSSCKLCKTINPANFKCIQCDQDMCARCKTSHQRIALTKDHTYQQLYDLLPSEVSDCTEFVLCKIHHKGVIVYCSSCERLVCPECIAEEHDKHKLEKIDNILEKKKPSFDVLSNDAKQYKSELISKKDFITNKRTNLTVKLEGLKSDIEQRKNYLIEKIQKQADNFILCLDTNKIQAINYTSKVEKTLSTTISELDTSLSAIDTCVENKARCILEFETLERKLTPRFKETLTLPTAEMVFEDETKFILGHLKVKNVITYLESCSFCHNVMTPQLMLPICKHVLCQECGKRVRDSRICPVCKYSYKIKRGNQPTGNIIVEVRDAFFVIRYSFVDQNTNLKNFQECEFDRLFITILPRNAHGYLVFRLLQTAFGRGLLFSINIQNYLVTPVVLAETAPRGIIHAYAPDYERLMEEMEKKEQNLGNLTRATDVRPPMPDEKQLERAIDFLAENGVIEVDL